MAQQYTAQQWRLLSADKMHLFFKHFAFLSQLNVEPDELRVCYLGVFQYILGSTLWCLVFVVFPGSANDNVTQVWAEMRAEYDALKPPCRSTNIELASILQHPET